MCRGKLGTLLLQASPNLVRPAEDRNTKRKIEYCYWLIPWFPWELCEFTPWDQAGTTKHAWPRASRLHWPQQTAFFKAEVWDCHLEDYCSGLIPNRCYIYWALVRLRYGIQHVTTWRAGGIFFILQMKQLGLRPVKKPVQGLRLIKQRTRQDVTPGSLTADPKSWNLQSSEETALKFSPRYPEISRIAGPQGLLLCPWRRSKHSWVHTQRPIPSSPTPLPASSRGSPSLAS